MRWVSARLWVTIQELSSDSLISDNATQRILWFLECQPVTLDYNEWQISKTLIQTNIQTQGQVSKRSSFYIWHFWEKKTNCWFRLIWGFQHRSRSRSRRSRYILPGAGAGAGAVEKFYSEPEPEPEPECFPGAGAGAGADQKCHGSASLASTKFSSKWLNTKFVQFSSPELSRWRTVRSV